MSIIEKWTKLPDGKIVIEVGGKQLSDVEKAVYLTRQLYEYESCGGPIHIVSDDGNLENYHLRYCWKYTNKEYEGEAKEIALEILKTLAGMDWVGRYAYYARLENEPSDMDPFDIEEDE